MRASARTFKCVFAQTAARAGNLRFSPRFVMLTFRGAVRGVVQLLW